MKQQTETPLKRKRMDFSNLKASRRFKQFIQSLINELDGKCFYCQKLLYTEVEVPYQYPDWYYEEGGPCFGFRRTFIDRTWDYHIDHKIPLSQDGTNDFDNLTLACPTCNSRKGAKLQWTLKS